MLASTATWNVMIRTRRWSSRRTRRSGCAGDSALLPQASEADGAAARGVEEAKGGELNVVAEWKAPEKENVLVTRPQARHAAERDRRRKRELVVHSRSRRSWHRV